MSFLIWAFLSVNPKLETWLNSKLDLQTQNIRVSNYNISSFFKFKVHKNSFFTSFSKSWVCVKLKIIMYLIHFSSFFELYSYTLVKTRLNWKKLEKTQKDRVITNFRVSTQTRTRNFFWLDSKFRVKNSLLFRLFEPRSENFHFICKQIQYWIYCGTPITGRTDIEASKTMISEYLNKWAFLLLDIELCLHYASI